MGATASSPDRPVMLASLALLPCLMIQNAASTAMLFSPDQAQPIDSSASISSVV